jgi:hypothetical protein
MSAFYIFGDIPLSELPSPNYFTPSVGLGGFEPYYFLCKEERDQNSSWY